jgi:hypothetical protein
MGCVDFRLLYSLGFQKWTSLLVHDRLWVCAHRTHVFCTCTEPAFQTFMEPRNRFQGMNSASLYSLVGRYDNPVPTRCLAPIDFFFRNSSSVQ